MTVHIGAYPTYGPPASPSAAAVVTLLAASPLVAGLELPFVDGEVALPPVAVPSAWQHVITLMPATMSSITADPAWGPASPDHAGRAAAIALLKAVRDVVSRRTDVAAVALQSAPARTGTPAAFAETLAEVASWDWNGARLVVEHCDAWSTRHRPEKGFLSLADELDVISSLSSVTPVTAGVNWARSVIETREVTTATEHVRSAAGRGLLGALMFSSVADVATDLGEAWRDVHLAPSGCSGAPAGSLLTPALVAEARRAAEPYDGILGLKVNLGPTVQSPADQAAGLLEVAALVSG
ncbi:MAG: DUF4862 family protein [Actinobacteria bacterium]|nr:DUF4862 family protein [Actinomycetota bacterium]